VYRFVAVLVLVFSAIPSVYGNTDEKELIIKMRSEFERIVGKEVVLDDNYRVWIESDVERLVRTLPEHDQVSQFFQYTDRNPERQIGAVVWYDGATGKACVIGADKLSTGSPKRKGHFETPVGAFMNTVSNLSYRAEGTKNKKGWRGLGAKGSRVWDFGWQNTVHTDGIRSIRLLMHATDPQFGESRLGKVDSKGCVRISAKMNKFLDQFGILDADYEKQINNKSVSWILKKDRTPIHYAGKYLLVGESN
jgi:hypothetical protein